MYQGIQQEIVAVIRDVGNLSGDIPSDKDLYSELGVESVNSIHLLLALEDKFGVSIDDTQFVRARTVAGLTNLIADLRGS
ncbi:MAG: phosphopantetheine-binding protein [candidate division Zixibacteria bacterium]|jgi:acyl carrier protein|nr:phosphopantetheine-binding protein [candidate division Zixibacteria bacterium]